MGLGTDRKSCETSLQEGHQPGTPIAENEKKQERNREVVFVVDSVVDREREVTSNRDFDPRNPSQTLAVLLGADFIFLRLNAVLGSSDKGSLFANERFKNGPRVGHGESDAEGHQEGQVEQGP